MKMKGFGGLLFGVGAAVYTVVLVVFCFIYIMTEKEPMGMGFGLVVSSCLVGALIAEEYSSYLGYLIFFIYLGGLMVMFSMVVSMAPNPCFTLNKFVPLFCLFGVFDLVANLLGYGFLSAGNKMSSSVKFIGGDGILGNLYDGLGVFGGLGWGGLLVSLGFLMFLSVVVVVNMSKRSSGPLVEFLMFVKSWDWRDEEGDKIINSKIAWEAKNKSFKVFKG